MYGAFRAFASWLEQLQKRIQASAELENNLGSAFQNLVSSILNLIIQVLPTKYPAKLLLPASVALISLSHSLDLLSHTSIHLLARDVPSIITGDLPPQVKVRVVVVGVVVVVVVVGVIDLCLPAHSIGQHLRGPRSHLIDACFE
jgi:hypothetical protein